MILDLVLSDIQTYYGVSHVLHGVSLTITNGKFVCLLGRNGMGKTTTLRSIMGLTSPKEGTISYKGRRIERLEPYQIFDLGIGYVPQGRHMFPYLTVKENLRLGLREKRQKDIHIFDKIFEYFPVLADRINQKAGTLSGGEQQMLAIGRALAGEIDLLLLDEPTEGIQPNIVDGILQLLSQINQEEGLTILLVEQNMEIALSLAEDYYIMEKGSIVESGAVNEIDRKIAVERYLVV